MAVLKGAEKRHRQSVGRRMRNRTTKNQIRSSVRKFLGLVQDGDKAEAEKSFGSVQKQLDTAKRRGIMHKNTVARTKSRLVKKLNNMNTISA